MLNYPLSVFLDTNIFISCKFDVDERGTLFLLKNLVDQHKVKLYVSHIVVRETERHLKSAISEAINQIKKARTEISKHISSTIVKDTSLSPIFRLPCQQEVEETALKNFRGFLDDSSAIYLNNAGIDIDVIINDYFEGNAPFEKNEGKKYEFPDAFIISKLKREFSDTNPVWVISGDKGFQRALDNASGFNNLSSIKELLDMINKQDEMYDTILRYIQNSATKRNIYQYIESKIESDDIEIVGMDSDRKGYCEGFDYEATIISFASIMDFKMKSIDNISKDLIVLTLFCKASISAVCYYSDYDNAPWDSEEKEYLFLSQEKVEEEHEPEFECSLSLAIDHKSDGIEFSLADVSYDLVLDQYTRTKRSFVKSEDHRIETEADKMDTLEEYDKH